MPLTESRLAFKPFEYPWCFEAWHDHEKMHWIHDEVAMGADVLDWSARLTPGEKELATAILRFFTQADAEVGAAYYDHYLTRFKPPEVRMMLGGFANREGLHQAAYSHLLETLGFPDAAYLEFLEYQEMVDKHEFNQSFRSDEPIKLAVTMAGFGGFVEGMHLFASFALLLNFARHGKLRGMGQIVSWSVRDESLHSLSVIRLFHTFVAENLNQDQKPKLVAEIIAMARHAVECERKFLELAYRSGAVENLTLEQMLDYVDHLADVRLVQLGIEPQFGAKADPIPWFAEMIGAPEHAAFFEAQPTSYAKGATSGDWENSFG